MPIALPKNPGGEDYEDLLTAILRVQGYFTETRLTLRAEKKEVLELDVVATPLGQGNPDKCLYEAKKASVKFEHIFKLYGQKTYLKIPSAVLVSMGGMDAVHEETYRTRAAEMGVSICALPFDPKLFLSLAEPTNELAATVRMKLIFQSWFEQIARRQSYAAFKTECRINGQTALYESAREYDFAIQESFFQPTAIDRARGLYEAYFAKPRLTGDFVSLIARDDKVTETTVWNRLNDTHKHLWLQYLMFLENVGRIAIIKNALDDILEAADDFRWDLLFLPQRFVVGLKLMKEHPHGNKLPYLFQVFLELFGGFLFEKDDQELSLISTMTQIPPDDIVPALSLLDHFFAPEGGSCFFRMKNELLCQKMVPGFLRGTGSFARRSAFGLKNYEAKYKTLGWLLGKWHNALYHSLEPALAV